MLNQTLKGLCKHGSHGPLLPEVCPVLEIAGFHKNVIDIHIHGFLIVFLRQCYVGISTSLFKFLMGWGAWVARSVKRSTSAQVIISRSVSLSPESGSVLTAQSLEPVSDSVSPSL